MDRKKAFSGVLGALILVFGLFIFLINVNLSHPVIQVSSCSNYPVLEPGNIVFVEETSFEDIEEGETVIYREPSNSMVIAHQVVGKSENSLQTKGENNPRQLEFEKNVRKSQVWGTKWFVIQTKAGQKCSAR